MRESRNSWPPLAALRAFHAVATHDRYRDAAASLGVTESAISHQIRRLEDFLHVALIDRSGGRARLTETGRRYFEQVEPAIRQIRAATEAILPASGRQHVRLTLPTSLAAAWLIPRVGEFERLHPDIDLQLMATTRVVDLGRDQVDLAIRHGKGSWPGVEATFLLEETAMPVCAPGYLSPLPARPTPEALATARLIVNASSPQEWEEWTRAHGLEPPTLAGAISLDTMEQVLQVAESGHGLAMGRRPLVDERLARERLITPFGGAWATGAGYYLCRAADTPPSAAAMRLSNWLSAVAEAWQASAASIGN